VDLCAALFFQKKHGVSLLTVLELVSISTGMSEPQKSKRRMGFATQDPEQVREWGAQGGRAAHRDGKAHTFTSEEARAAGRKGARISHERRRARKESEATR